MISEELGEQEYTAKFSPSAKSSNFCWLWCCVEENVGQMTFMCYGHNKAEMKPVVICNYNNTMGGVDLCGQEMSYYSTLRKQQVLHKKFLIKWWNYYVKFLYSL